MIQIHLLIIELQIMKDKFINYYMRIAEETANLSYAKRLKVGCIIVKDNRTISIGYNGSAPGDCNDCEDKLKIDRSDSELITKITEYMRSKYYTFTNHIFDFKIVPHIFHNGAIIDHVSIEPYYDRFNRIDHDIYLLKTKSETIHAEHNAISKLSKSHESSEGASMFITHSPCMECCKNILMSGIKEVYYKTDYRSLEGIAYLNSHGVVVNKI